ncbi:hypothetical protein [Nocardia sp. NPDC049149]|uniref:hypothetical protein n=1 Tax=Nocardia sp. NPDC049149 TaxID=3364315 RepID=UPI00371ADA00
MKSIGLYLFGHEVLTVKWNTSCDAGADEDAEADEDAPDLVEDDADGISYSCGHCGEVLVSGLQNALTRRDSIDLLMMHECPTRTNEDGTPVR